MLEIRCTDCGWTSSVDAEADPDGGLMIYECPECFRRRLREAPPPPPREVLHCTVCDRQVYGAALGVPEPTQCECGAPMFLTLEVKKL